jgi:hypothetical protein
MSVGRRSNERADVGNHRFYCDYSAGAICLFPAEVFSIVEAKEAFRHFFETGNVPPNFGLRDVTEEKMG